MVTVGPGPRPRIHSPARIFERPRAAQAPPGKGPRPPAPSAHSPPGHARIPTRPPPTSRPYPQPHQGPRPAHAAHLAALADLRSGPHKGPHAGTLADLPTAAGCLDSLRPAADHQRTRRRCTHGPQHSQNAPPARRSSARDHGKRRKP